MVPGITAALGAAAQFEVPLTFRHEALRITFLTAHKAKDTETVDWSALTDEKMTVVVYMGMTAAPSVRAGLLAAGRSPQTPVGVFARVTRPDAQAVVGTLDELPALVGQVDGGPAMLVIGDVVAHSAPWRYSNLTASHRRNIGSCRMTSPLQQKNQNNGPSMVTANRTSDGVVIYRTAAAGRPTGRRGYRPQCRRSAGALAKAIADDVGAIGSYIAPVEIKDGGAIKPGNLREHIRSEGVTIDLPVPA